MHKFAIISIILVVCAAFAGKAPALALDGSVFSGKQILDYGLFDGNDDEIAVSKVVIEVVDGMLLIEDSINESAVRLTMPDLLPSSGVKIIHYQGDYEIHSVFTEDSIIVDAKTPRGDEHVSIELTDETVFHNDQLLFSIPAMDFTVKKKRLSLFIPANSSVIEMMIVVKGEEKVTVPAGEFDVFKVALDFGMNIQQAYYEVASPHRLILYDNGQIQYRFKGESESETEE